jgi:DNA-binding NarL/FixJ family response regulator
MPRPVRIVIVEDNDVFREALVLLLGQRPEVDVVAAVALAEEALEVCQAEQPDVVLMDYRLPGMDGVRATTAVRAASPGSAVVSLTASATPSEARALLEAGAATCLTKDAPLEEIIRALLEVAETAHAPAR